MSKFTVWFSRKLKAIRELGTVSPEPIVTLLAKYIPAQSISTIEYFKLLGIAKLILSFIFSHRLLRRICS